ncbi:MAG TPA: phosphatidylserine/phosphatidylglycerophosphate/cardiolipin synthase family protein, partial [Vicinamibacteria bacterium]|nr:phosphatidylserine/phosphatidylglycerophosphate/cardiolipin synthase family protein [Vicinamibacteria bacterium]
MNYRRVLFLTGLGEDSRPAAALIRRVAPGAELAIVVACVPERQIAWLADEAAGDLNGSALAAVDALRDSVAGVAERVEVKLASALVAGEMGEVVEASGIDLLAAGPLPLTAIPVLAELRKRHSLAVLWAASPAGADRPVIELLCVAPGIRERGAIAAFLRDHGSPSTHATILVQRPGSTGGLAARLDMAGITASVDLVTLAAGLSSWLGAASGRARTDLLVLPRFPGPLLPVTAWPAPTLVLPPTMPVARELRRALDVPDLVAESGTVRARLDFVSGVGRRDPIPDQRVAFVSGGRIAEVVATSHGECELRPGIDVGSLGVFRVPERGEPDPLAVIEEHVSVLRPGSRPWVLFDAGLP